MNIDDWFQWPTRSTDPGVNFFVAIVLLVITILLIVATGAFLIPIIVMIGIAKGVACMNRPVPTDQLYALTQQRGVSANFPTTSAFMNAHLDRFLDAIKDDLPSFHIYLTMAQITEALYEEEKLHNPLPPLSPVVAVSGIRRRPLSRPAHCPPT